MTALMLWEAFLEQKVKKERLIEEAKRIDAEFAGIEVEIRETLTRLDGKVLIHANTDSTTAYWLDGLLNLHSAPCIWTHEIDVDGPDESRNRSGCQLAGGTSN